MQYGVDVGSQRLDDLDKRVLARVKELVNQGERPRVLDVGCGQGGLAAALVALGAEVVALDIDNYQDSIGERLASQGHAMTDLIFVHADIRDWLKTTTEHFDIVVLQRVLHYLPYNDTVVALRALSANTEQLFVAVSGLTTAIGEHYDVLHLPITERWGRLTKVGQELFSIRAPLCLYTEHEVRELLKQTNWEIEWLRVSDFGNVKVEARRS